MSKFSKFRSKTWPVFRVYLDLRSKYILVGRPTQTYLDPQSKVLNIFSELDLSNPPTIDNESQAQAARGGCPPGAVNYQSNLLVDIIERLLPQGLEGWRKNTVEYQRGSNEVNLCRGEMQMAVMERRAETSEKYLCRIAKTMGDCNNKRKRGGFDDDDGSSDENE